MPIIKKPNQHFDATTYTGNGGTQVIVNQGQFKPDFVWIKDRTSTYPNMLFDSVRGVSKRLISNTTDAEATETDTQTSFNSNGFSVSTNLVVNATSDAFVAWQWKAGEGTTTVNTSGTISSNVSVNTTAGFSVVTWTGNGTAGATVGHGLGVAPSWVIIKNRTATGGEQWLVWHKSISQAIHTSSVITLNGYTGALLLNGTGASISYGFDAQINGSTNGMLAYCWSEIAGFSKFGSWTGNASTNGPFVYTGFRPKFVLFKNSSAATVWIIFDTARNTYNFVDTQLRPNASDADNSAGSAFSMDILSNGFKLRSSDSNFNGSGNTIIYAAFAENPFKNANAR